MARHICLISFFVFTTGCFPEVEALCEDVAFNECQRCFECGDEAGPTSNQLCRLNSETELTEERCRSLVAERCSYQASTLDEPKKDLNECIDTQETDTCEAKLNRQALDQTTATSQCAYFL